MVSRILQRIYEASVPVELPPSEWSFLQPSPSVRCLRGDSLELLQTLKNEFTDEQIKESGIAVRNGEGNLQLRPWFAEPGLAFLCLRRTKADSPYDLVSAQGSLINDEPPCFVACQDYFTDAWRATTRNILFVTFDMLGAAILRMLSLPVTVAAGLNSLNGEQLRLLCGRPEKFEGRPQHHVDQAPQQPRAEICSRGIQLALVGWNLSEFRRSVPDGVVETVARFAESGQAFGFDVSNVRLWQPPNSAIEEIHLAATLRDRELVRKSTLLTLENSLFDVTKSHNAFNPKPQVPRADYCAARRELLHTVTQARDLRYASPELTKKLEKLNGAFDQTVIEPLLKDAAMTPDSMEASLLMSAAELTERLHRGSPLVRSAQKDQIRGRDRSDTEFDHEELKQRLVIVEQLISIRKELRGK